MVALCPISLAEDAAGYACSASDSPSSQDSFVWKLGLMRRRFRARYRSVTERHILHQEIQQERRDPEDCAELEDPLDSAKQCGSDVRIQRFEHTWTVVQPAERGLQLWPHLRQQQWIGKSRDGFLRDVARDGVGEVAMILREQETSEDGDTQSASNRSEKSR